jgi:hypothetical protein
MVSTIQSTTITFQMLNEVAEKIDQLNIQLMTFSHFFGGVATR